MAAAQAVVNLKYIGQGPSGDKQVFAGNEPGPAAKTLYAYGTLVASSGTFCSETAATINFVDGTAGLLKVPAIVDVFVAGNSGDSAAALAGMGASPVWASAVGSQAFTLNHASITTTGATVTIGAIIAFSS